MGAPAPPRGCFHGAQLLAGSLAPALTFPKKADPHQLRRPGMAHLRPRWSQRWSDAQGEKNRKRAEPSDSLHHTRGEHSYPHRGYCVSSLTPRDSRTLLP